VKQDSGVGDLIFLSRFWKGPPMAVKKPELSSNPGNCTDLRLEEFFDGQCQAWGMFESRSGQIKNYFKVLTSGEWDGEKLALEEKVLYPDQSTDQRQWTICKSSPNTYKGYTKGLKGEATGMVKGSHFHWNYTLSWKYKNRKWTTSFNDQMWLHNDKTLINRVVIKKCGITLGKAWIFFSREPTLTSITRDLAQLGPH
tara:strand:- start:212 stop:805 length:594 start_codon:yes stop_codon:yes gene_type:complete